MAQKPTLKVGHIRITDHLILGITKDKINKGTVLENLNLETSVYRGWNPLQEDLRSGTVDAAFILAPIAMELFQNGIKLKLVLQAHKSGSVLIINKRANIETLEDFKGKTILIPHYLSVHHLLFDKLLRESGIPIGVTDVRFEVEAPSEIPEIIEWDEEGTVGGFIVAEPFGSQVVKAGYGDEFKLSKDIWPNHPCCVFVVRQEFIDSNKDGIQELVNNFVASGQMVQEDIDSSAAVGAEFLDQEVDVIKRVLTDPPDRVIFNELLPVVDDYDYMQTYLTETIKAMSGKIDLDAFVDSTFAEKAGAA